MWSPLVLCLLVAFACASDNPAWSPQKHYVYEFRARSLASLNQQSDYYSGILIKAQLDVQPSPDGSLGAKITKAQYASVQQPLEEGWEEDIPDSLLTYKPLPLSSQPFRINFVQGAIRDVIVDKKMTNWEANMIKSAVSQLQLDTKATNLIPSYINILTQEDSNTAVFKTMEETVSGVAETLYEIHPYPDYIVQSRPWEVPFVELLGDGDFIEVVKTKNYTNGEQIPSYHMGLYGVADYRPSNKIAQFLSRSSVTRAVITGTLNEFTVQSSVTTEEISLRPTFGDAEQGSVNTKVNLTLRGVIAPLEQSSFQVGDGVGVGVVYGYDNPFGPDNGPRPARPFDHSNAENSHSNENSGEEHLPRNKRSAKSKVYPRQFNFAQYQTDSGEDDDWQQDKPGLNEPPASPLLPFTVGYNGQALKQQKNIVEVVRKLAQEIGAEFEHPKQILKEHTVGKFVMLASLVRTMTTEEIGTVASQLYPQQPAQPSYAWVAYRDAVAQAGTSPALVNIKEWITSDKIVGREGGQVISAAANSARAPTEAHMKLFFQIIQNDEIMLKPHINESALLAYSALAFDVYAHRGYSHGKYPVYSFGSFRTSNGIDHIKNIVIPHLTQKLNSAIIKADTPKIHAYIRALGNLGQQRILIAFKPYLEGTKKASHFQRVLMVAALDRLVKSHPKVGRAVLYRIYQNPSENEEVRVAAVFLLMQTQPPADMLQRMAAQTNVDSSDFVNAAVKSAIESAVNLEGSEQVSLREAAKSAEPLLTSQEFGVQYAQSHLRSYVVHETELAYHQDILSFGSQDHFFTKGIKYSLQKDWGGVHQGILSIHALVSSVDDLINVFERQTKQYQERLHQKQEQKPEDQRWTSEYVAHVLGLENDQREQLEGWFYAGLSRSWQEMFSFDNHTFERMPQYIEKIESEWKQGKQLSYNKMINLEESSLAVPTILGLSFLYTYDRPALVKFAADIKAQAQPPISANNKIHEPESVNVDFDVKTVVSGRVQAQLGIVTPFDLQRYSAGYIKNYQVDLPLVGKLQLKLKTTPTFSGQQLQVLLENPSVEDSGHLVHYSSWPYVSQHDIFTTKPDLKIIMSDNPFRISKVFGEKSTGVAAYVHVTSDLIIDPGFFYDKLKSEDFVSVVLNPWADNSIQYVHIDFGIDSAKSTAQKFNLHFGHKYEYQPSQPSPNVVPRSPREINSIPQFPEESEPRQKDFLDKLGDEFNNARVHVVDVTAEFSGSTVMKYSVTAGMAKNDVGPHTRYIALIRHLEKQVMQTQAYVLADAQVPNTNGLNMDYAMQIDPTSTAFVQYLLQKPERLSRAYANVKLSKSKERVNYLKQQLDYRICKRQMQEGNTQLPICAKMTAAANLLDEFSVKTKYYDMDPKIINATYFAYQILRHQLYPRLSENILAHSLDNQFDIQGQFSPDLNRVNFSVYSDYGDVDVWNVPLSPFAQELLVPHPVFHIKSRVEGDALKYDTYRPICVVDSTATSTLDNKTYPASFSDKWTVVLQYIPRRPSSQKNKIDQSVLEQLIQQDESYIVYARAHRQSKTQKEISIVFQMPKTDSQIVRLTMSPGRANANPKVYLNDQEVIYDDQHSTDYYDGNLQIYALPNKEVKVELRNVFYVLFNGQTLKLTVVNSKFRDAARGLCGTFSGELETDFVDPKNCILSDSASFVNSYTVPEDTPKPRFPRGAEDECYQKRVYFASYISNRDAGLSGGSSYGARSNPAVSCTSHQTKYEERGHEICFTVRPMPVCKPGCVSTGTITKSVDVHCQDPSKSTNLWKAEILKGASPDFSSYAISRRIPMLVPLGCKSAN